VRNRCMAILLALVLAGTGFSQAEAAFSKGSFVPCSVLSSPTDQSGQVYRIRSGDTLWEIAKTHGVDLDELLVLNHMSANTILKIGQELIIPSSGLRLHYIKPGESMWKIATSYNISIAELTRLNPEHDPDHLKIGAALKLPQRAATRVAMAEPSRSWSALGSLMSWPITGVITSRYGWRSSGFHHGLDIAAQLGTPIQASAGGKVIFAGYKGVYGRTVMIEQADGKVSLYAHAQKIYVKPGQKITKGQTIATVGSTGNATGPHLHYEIRQNGETVDPAQYLR
jgi:murein DD-endopeptidase MepM/ murein hydrolase activator NlpD